MPRSVFHGLSTAAIPSDSKAAVGRRWETRHPDRRTTSSVGPRRKGVRDSSARNGTSPLSIQGRVAFPTPSPAAPRFLRGTAPWTKRGKRATAVPFVPVGRARRQRVPGDATSPLSIGPGRDPPNRRILLTYTVFGRRLSTSRSTLPVTPAVKRKTSPRFRADHLRVPAHRPRRRPPRRRPAADPALPGSAPRAGARSPRLPAARHPARRGRRADVAPGAVRAGVPGVAWEGRRTARVPGGALLHPGQPRPLPGRGRRQRVPGERHEEPGRAVRAVREPGVRTRRPGAGVALPPRS